MSKRLTDTMIWKKDWFKKLDQTHKLFWFYILSDCDHAGIWELDFEVASLRIGAPLNVDETMDIFKEHIEPIADGNKWLIKDFLEFQYGTRSRTDKAYISAVELLERSGVGASKEPPSPLVATKDKDKDKDKDKSLTGFSDFWSWYPRRQGKGAVLKIWERLKPNSELLEKMRLAIEIQKKTEGWQKEKGQFIPMPATWLNQQRWLDEVVAPIPIGKDPVYKPYVAPVIPPGEEAKGSLLDGMIQKLKEKNKP